MQCGRWIGREKDERRDSQGKIPQENQMEEDGGLSSRMGEKKLTWEPFQGWCGQRFVMVQILVVMEREKTRGVSGFQRWKGRWFGKETNV